MRADELEKIEINLLIEAIRQRYDFDFSHYSRASFKRRVLRFLSINKLVRIADAIPHLLHDRAFFEKFIFNLSITVTEMFRDPLTFRAIREEVIPRLKAYSSLKIWHAGCSTGEEVYALAILLREEGLYERSQIYATDFNDQALDIAKEGIYSADRLPEFEDNYRKSGGQGHLGDYFHAKYQSVIIRQELKKNIFFANHNLISDYCFGEMNLIVCRNVLIYFDKFLQNNVFKLFIESLSPAGILWLGSKESLPASAIGKDFKVINQAAKIFARN